jgi:hypothetical protein
VWSRFINDHLDNRRAVAEQSPNIL